MSTLCANIFVMYLSYVLDKNARLAATAVAQAAALASNKLGVESYSKSRFQEAIQHFSSAIELDGTDHIFYYNRSYANQQIKSIACSIADARKVSINSK